MKNYDVCKDINEYYFKSYASIALAIPAFFDEISEQAGALAELKKNLETGDNDAVVALAAQYAERFPLDEHAFSAMQVFAFWQQGKIPNAELIAYFETLEEILPGDAIVNFDKAVLHVREKNFNEAVAELKKALRKKSDHAASFVLLFWIYYFSRDEEWKPMFKTILTGKTLPENIVNIVSIIESIQDGKATPLYAFADADVTAGNKELFAKFPELVMVREPRQENVLLVGAEGNYLRSYVVPLMLSMLELKDKNFGLHVHLYAPLGVDLEILEAYAEKYPDINLSYSYEKDSVAYNTENPIYYASMRFCRAYQVLCDAASVKKIAIVDADLLVRKNLFARDDVKNSDIALTSSPDVTPAWEKFAGGFASFSKSEFSLKAFAYLSNVIMKNFSKAAGFWFIDQVALFDMHRHFEKLGTITRVSLAGIFGEGMAHTAGATLWTYTNEDKGRDNPMNREIKRLVAERGIRFDWNVFAKAKYGTIIANRNDQFVGRTLLAYGSWCDFEMKILKLLLDFGDTVLEIGSNIGSHTLPLARYVGSRGRVYAMEPQRIVFQTLCSNIAMNSLANVYTLNVACGESEGSLNVTELDPTEEQNFGGYRPKLNLGETAVPIRTIDSLNLSSCKLIKMDIEGMEFEALKGGRKTLQELQPMIFFEAHGDSVYEIDDFLKTLGYRIYDFGASDDPMYLGATDRHEAYALKLGAKPLASKA